MSAEDMVTEPPTDDKFGRDPQPGCRDSSTVDDTLNVSVMSLSGNVLGTVPVSSQSCVWDIKCSIAEAIPEIQMHPRRMQLVLGSHILADRTLVHDTGIATRAMLTVIRTPPYKILASRDNVAELWNDEGRLDGVLLGHEGIIYVVQFSSDTNLVITCSSDNTAKLWEVASRKCLFTLRHEPTLLTASFNTTGTTVVTTKLPHELKQWCVRSGACISTLRLSAHGRIDFAFTAQGVNVLHTSGEGCATLWNMETGTRLWEHGIDVPSFRFQGACLSRCGNWFCTMTHRRDSQKWWGQQVWHGVEIWNAMTCSIYHSMRVTSCDDGVIEKVGFSLDALRLFTVCGNRYTRGRLVTVWNIGHDLPAYTFKQADYVASAKFSPEGRQLLTIAAGQVWVWWIDEGTLEWCIPEAQVWKAYFTPDGKGVVLTGRNGTDEWDTASREHRWKVGDKVITAIALSSLLLGVQTS